MLSWICSSWRSCLWRGECIAYCQPSGWHQPNICPHPWFPHFVPACTYHIDILYWVTTTHWWGESFMSCKCKSESWPFSWCRSINSSKWMNLLLACLREEATRPAYENHSWCTMDVEVFKGIKILASRVLVCIYDIRGPVDLCADFSAAVRLCWLSQTNTSHVSRP